MSTQPYIPQPGIPPQRAGKFSPVQGLAEIVAIASLPGETTPSSYGGPEIKFRLTDGRIWYVPPVVADEIYRMGVQPRQQVEVLKYGRMKHELRITPLPANLGAEGTVAAAPPVSATPTVTMSYNQQSNHTPAPPPPAAPVPVQTPAMKPAAACMMAAMCAAVDAIIETQAYATRRGLGVTFSEESVRAIGLSIYIQTCRDGGAR